MKRRNLILSFVIVALMLVGIGFAAVSAVDLQINGSATAETTPFDVQFVEHDDFNLDGAKHVATMKDGVSATNALDAIGEEKEYVLTIKNMSADYAATVTVKVDAADTDYFNYTVELSDSGALAKSGTITVTITVALKAIPLNTTTENFSVELLATPVANVQ